MSISRRAPLGLIGAIVLIAAVHFALESNRPFWEWFRMRTLPSRTDNLRLEADFHLMPPRDADPTRVFLVGSSQTREGIDADRLNEHLGPEGVRIYNLGLSGAQGIDMYMLAERFIAERPDAMLIAPSIHSFYFSYDLTKLPLVFAPEEAAAWARNYGLRDLWSRRESFISSGLSVPFPLYRHRDAMSDIILKETESLVFRQPIEPPPFSLYKFPIGFMHDESYFRKYGAMPDMFKIDEFTPRHQEHFRWFAENVVEAGIKLIVLDAPVHRATRKVYDVAKIDRDMRDFFTNSAREIGFSYYPIESLPPFTDDEFADFLHLNYRGRDKFTAAIEEILRKELGGE